MNYWEIIADRLGKEGWSWGYSSQITSSGQTIFTADAHRDGKRFIVHADEKLSVLLLKPRREKPLGHRSRSGLQMDPLRVKVSSSSVRRDS